MNKKELILLSRWMLIAIVLSGAVTGVALIQLLPEYIRHELYFVAAGYVAFKIMMWRIRR